MRRLDKGRNSEDRLSLFVTRLALDHSNRSCRYNRWNPEHNFSMTASESSHIGENVVSYI